MNKVGTTLSMVGNNDKLTVHIDVKNILKKT